MPDRVVTIGSRALEADFVPDLGMLGTSIRHQGDELLCLPADLDAHRRGELTGLPLLAPWANRLGKRSFVVDGQPLDLRGLDLVTDGRGLPIHGTMVARRGWVIEHASDRALEARFDTSDAPELLAAFPFPHELRLAIEVDEASLSIATSVVPTSARTVPVSFGFHPYFALPGVDRSDVRLGLPARHHVELDDRMLPTGETTAETAEDEVIGQRSFDDHYRLGEERTLTLTGGGRRLSLHLDEGYDHAQVYAPFGAAFVCLEPMTAPVNALVEGTHRSVAPHESFTATFRISLTQELERTA